RIAFQGEAGAFGEDAVLRHWAGAALAIPARTFEDALAMVLSGRCDGAVLPVWNSTVGEVGPAREALREAGAALNVDTELMIPVRHCLAALPGAGLDQIRYVASHPVALSQCARFLRDHDHMIACDAYDTAGAARE